MVVKNIGCILTIFLILSTVRSVYALGPDEVLLVVNGNVPASMELAGYYRDRRDIPVENLLTVDMPAREDCSREEYRQRLLDPVRAFLSRRQGTGIRCILLFHGIPLRVDAPELTHLQGREWAKLKNRKMQIDRDLEYGALSAGQKQQRQRESERLRMEIKQLQPVDQRAAVDSEIALALYETYPLEKWLANPFYVGFQNRRDTQQLNKDRVLFVARLDGPTPEVVRRVIDDSLFAEQAGLKGRAYFDARWPLPGKKNLQGYALYDASLHIAAELTGTLSRMPVHLDQQEQLLQPGSAPEAALYCGWYSLGKYVDAFQWQRGAVGYHIASSECVSLKKSDSQGWCKRMLEDGVAATLGPVAEPYVQGFPLPDLFFGFLLDGYYTLVESYFLSTPFLSWQMILVGDPLYRPFRNQVFSGAKEL